MALYDIFQGEELKIAEKIQQRRLQMLVHSYLYYERDTTVIPDFQWAAWGKELVKLTNSYPAIAEKVPYGEGFEDFDASTGFTLPYNKPNIITTACRLANIPFPKDDPKPAPKPKPAKTVASPLFSKASTAKPPSAPPPSPKAQKAIGGKKKLF